jgi:hypothetical protein
MQHLLPVCACTGCRLKGDPSIHSFAKSPGRSTPLGKARCSGKKPRIGFIQAELVSPILQGQSGLEQVARALAVLNTLPVEVNWRTGLHIHVSIMHCRSITKQRADR